MSRARLVALSGICSAVSLLSIFFANYVTWLSFMLGVISACAVSVPLLVDAKNGLYSLLCYVASAVLGVFLGVGNILYVLPIAVFAMPFALVKVYGEYRTVTDCVVKYRIPKVWRWVIFYALCEVCLALTFGACYLFTPAVFEKLTSNYLILVVALIVNAVIPLYDKVMTGCLSVAAYAVKKVWK